MQRWWLVLLGLHRHDRLELAERGRGSASGRWWKLDQGVDVHTRVFREQLHGPPVAGQRGVLLDRDGERVEEQEGPTLCRLEANGLDGRGLAVAYRHAACDPYICRLLCCLPYGL